MQQEAAFRGRLLVSKRVALPEGYTGLVFSTSQPVAAAAPLAPTTPSKRAGTAPKRVKVDAAAERKAAAERAKGLRRSPRKRVVKKEVKKFMLDSDDEEDQENEPVAEAPKEEEAQEEEKVKMVVEETIAVEEETTITEAPPASAPAHQESTPEPEPEAPTAETQDDDLPLARDERHLVPVLTFNSIDIWHPDYAGDLADDVYARTMSEWVGVSAKVSSDHTEVHKRRSLMLTMIPLPRSTLTRL